MLRHKRTALSMGVILTVQKRRVKCKTLLKSQKQMTVTTTHYLKVNIPQMMKRIPGMR